MKPKTVLIVAVAVACIGDVVAQDRLIHQALLRLSRPSDWRVVQSVENELKDVWAEPDEDFKQLTERAMKDDPQALYALSQVCKEKGLPYRTWSKYLNRSAELDYAKAQLRVALNHFCEGFFRGDTNELQKVKAYCTHAINTGYLCVTNLIPLVDESILKREVADQEENRKKEEREQLANELKEAERVRDQRLQTNDCARQNKECTKIPGVTAPLVPFEEKDKIPYEDAVEMAKNNNAEAFYWLAYYFSKGEGVERNNDAAGEFLQKAADAGHAKACYLVGLHHACYSLYSLDGEGGYVFGGRRNHLLPREDTDEIKRVLAGDYYFTLKMPSEEDLRHGLRGTRPAGRSINCCFTNEVATGYVINWLILAAKGGLSYATNDVARIKRAANECKKQIDARVAAENAKKAKGAVALELLVKNETPKDNVKKETKDDSAGEDRADTGRQQAYWATWPATLTDAEDNSLKSKVETKFNCVFSLRPMLNPRIFLRRPESWVRGCGKSLIVATDNSFQKIDSNGQIVAWGLYVNRFDLEELKWYETEKQKMLDAKREKWASERNMSLDEAKRKHQEWIELTGGNGGFASGMMSGTLGGRRLMRLKREEEQRKAIEREAKSAEEKAQRDAEREEQLKALQEIQEALKRQREEMQKHRDGTQGR